MAKIARVVKKRARQLERKGRKIGARVARTAAPEMDRLAGRSRMAAKRLSTRTGASRKRSWYHCIQCGHDWRSVRAPMTCPACGSARWDEYDLRQFV